MANKVTLEFAGDSRGLEQAAKRADDAIETVGTSANTAASDMQSAGQASTDFSSKLGSLGAGVSGLTDGVDSASAAMQGLVDIQNASRERAMKLARAQADVEQAYLDQRQATIDLEQSQVDLNQAQADGRQAGIDLEQSAIDVKQSQIDAKTALDDYNAAVKEHGKNSTEAQQASVDLSQAQLDEKQALEDANQARIDANQALTDGKQFALDGAQAVRDGKDAQLDLNDALSEANPSGLSQWNDKLQLLTPILSGVVGVIGLVTAAQWAWNAALAATGIPLIIAGVALLIGAIVLIATKTTWFQDAWKWAWGGIKAAAQAVGQWFSGPFAGFFIGVWNRIKAVASGVGNWFSNTLPNFFTSAWARIRGAWSKVTGWFSSLGGGIKRVFSNIGSAITAPFRAAFNAIARAWNGTVGRLSFTVPGWVPGIGGNSFSAPRLPTYHSGGKVPGTPGQEVMAILRAGERVSSESSQISGGEWIPIGRGDALLDTLLALLAEKIDRKGGRASQLGIRVLA